MLSPATIRKIIKELGQLRNEPLEDIRVRVDEDDVLQFVGIIAGPEGTPYHGGYFNVRFTFGNEFPAAPPKCNFTTKIFHPNVSASGDICVNTLKKDWKSSYGIGHILTVIKCLLIVPNPESALDEEAGKMLLDDYDGYFKRAKLMTGIHATRDGIPPEFQDDSEGVPEDSLAISFLGTTGSSSFTAPPAMSSLPSGSSLASSSVSSSSRTISNDPATSTSSLTMAPRPASTATTAAKQPRATSQSPLLSTIALPGGQLPPLQTSAQSNGAPPMRNSPAPDKDADGNSINATSAASKKDAAATKTSSTSASAAAKVKAVKRPASGISGGVKENGNGTEKRKKGLKRL